MSLCMLLTVVLCLAAGPLAAQESNGGRDDSPFALHIGAAFARVDETDFEVVRALSGQDLFSQVRANDSRTDAAVFVSQRLAGPADAGLRAYATLGTAIGAPADVLYFGGSIGVSRTFVTVGAVTSVVEHGAGSVPDDVFRGAGNRTLFAATQRSRQWGLLLAVSFGVLQ